MLYRSAKGGGKAVNFEQAILAGYAPDGGLYVPESLPEINVSQLNQWRDLSYKKLAFNILSLFIDRNIISSDELKGLLDESYDIFEHEEVIPFYALKSYKKTYVMELFYGPTLSFKDIGMSFLVNLVNFFLKRNKQHLSAIVATTGDTGPAAAHFIAGKSNLDGWLLYPKGLITESQERQMTTLQHPNIHPVGVYNCPEGGDDLDVVISKLYKNTSFKKKLKLSSVNSLNWGRVMMQTVHYFYGYLKISKHVGHAVNMVVPSGGFGNLCAGGLARKMGLPIKNLIVANNKNACLHRLFSKGIFSKEPIHETVSSAIDILIPINFWRYLYFCVDGNAKKIKNWVDAFEKTGKIVFDANTYKAYSKGFLSLSISDEETLTTMKNLYKKEKYLLDPHGGVAMTAAKKLKKSLGDDPLICLTTAHPAKFPEIIEQISKNKTLPKEATHPSIEDAKTRCQKGYTCDYTHLYKSLINAMETNWELHHKNIK